MPTVDQTFPLAAAKGNGLLWLTMCRPQAYNAFTAAMLDAISAALSDAAKDPAVKAVVLTGAGKAFSAGQDLKEFLERGPSFIDELRGRYNPLVLKIRRIPKPVIAAVNGTAAGAGMSLALACDFRLCTPETKFYTAFVKVGLIPDSGSLLWLGALAGMGRALELAMTGRPLTAQEAESWGLVNKIVPAEKLKAETEDFAKPFIEGPGAALGLIKELYNQTLFARSLEAHLDGEALLQQAAGSSADHGEGIKAFLEKRAPRFSGR